MQLSATRALPLFVPTMVHAYNLIKSIVLYFQDIRTHLAKEHSIYQNTYSMSITHLVEAPFEAGLVSDAVFGYS